MNALASLISLMADRFGISTNTISARKVYGGSINQCYQVTAGKKNYFCKINSRQSFPGMFEAERIGLDVIADTKSIRVPAVIDMIDTDAQQFLILEWIEPKTHSPKFWTLFGESLAKMHEVRQLQPGFSSDNYIGSLRQFNTPKESWVSFFIEQRLQVQVRMARNNNLLDKVDLVRFDRLYEQLDQLLPEEPDVLLHGDLWSGNFMCDVADQPVIFDPAVYYGSRHIDLAMTTLFGGFDQAFYKAYQYNSPLPSNYQEVWALMNLYPLLVHLNLFGAAYRSRILNVLKHF
jgi:protein-ribulosamine 3-kinase